MPALRPMEHDMMPFPSDAAHDDLCPPPPMDATQDKPLELPTCLEPGPTIAGVPSLRFRSSKRIRRFDLEYPHPLLVTVNGRPVYLLEPGSNLFDPPLELQAGDTLQLEELVVQCAPAPSPMPGGGPGRPGVQQQAVRERAAEGALERREGLEQAFEGLDALEELEELRGLDALQTLEELRGLEELKGLDALDALEGLQGLDAPEDLDLTGCEVVLEEESAAVEDPALEAFDLLGWALSDEPTLTGWELPAALQPDVESEPVGRAS